jgi:GDP-4-dehydro-6-deoxy-D-mannose reductase
MRVLVTGANGFVGSYVLKEMESAGHSTVACDCTAPVRKPAGEFRILDITKAGDCIELARSVRPDACIHLAGLSFVPDAESNPDRLFAVNVDGTINLLNAFRQHVRQAKVLFVSTAHVYGFQPSDTPLTESAPLRPANLYAASKAMSDMASIAFAKSFNMPVMTVRPCNHIGPGQSDRFVVASFARQLGAIRSNTAEPVIRTGNLESQRDFLDVRDVAEGYRLLLEKGRPGQAYNMVSGRMHSIRQILDMLCNIAGVHPEISQDPARTRSNDNPPVLDDSMIRSDTGWTPRHSLRDTLIDVLKTQESG